MDRSSGVPRKDFDKFLKRIVMKVYGGGGLPDGPFGERFARIARHITSVSPSCDFVRI